MVDRLGEGYREVIVFIDLVFKILICITITLSIQLKLSKVKSKTHKICYLQSILFKRID